ncbi:carboxypeptidase-like regulatory domain-containing protein [Flammeovirgaceae bacterium SG7u.111]|nr:carboxypeptidase-like regulatory domain-containing protein [Flammeovirgaceae bacterium SG7u.132]WPO35156.1 carboxypeptidase-like regulatory domain-containing protein [Flammeovirgaceae bacterium SG7u.111]
MMRQKLIFTVLSLLFAAQVFSQTETVVKGVVEDDAGEPVIGANVVLEGTTVGTITDIDGKFSLKLTEGGKQTLTISFIGFKSVSIPLDLKGGTFETGTLSLESEAIGLAEVQVLASVAVDRKTPVAVAQINSVMIAEQASNQEFPELLKSTPGVYTTKQGGGYGDSRITVRGFNDQNVAVMINGIPVNDMENGSIYWSNWAGLTDVTESMQVQRGLGAAKVAVPSIGGTINILTKTTGAKKGGNIFYGTGNDGYEKLGLTLSTGLMENGWAVSVSGSKVEGNGYVEGTGFEGYNYFFNVTKQINKSHILSLTGFGAPQKHGQRVRAQTIEDYRNAPQGIKWNETWGYKNGQETYYEDNFYHKPQFSLNHYWTINSKSELSTALYMSFGTGGGGGTYGDWSPAYEARSKYEPLDLDVLVDVNKDPQYLGNSQAFMRASRNDHKWFGALSTYTNQITSNFNLLAGIDLRHYVGSHFYEVTDLLGGEYVLDNSDINNPNRLLNVGDKFNYNNDGVVNWTGVFLQGEYSQGKLDAFATVSLSNTGYKRIDYFNYLDSDPLQETDFANFFGYQVKGGANYNLTQNHNIFVNVGFFEKAPDFDGVYLNNDQFVNDAVENQKILSYELGYGYRSEVFNANVNLYRTSWLDRTLTESFSPTENDPDTPEDERDLIYNASLLGVDALHQGLEIDFVYKPVEKLTINGMVSLGDWKWSNDVDGQYILDENQDTVGVFDKLYIGGLKVGDVAQHTYALGASYEPFKGLKLNVKGNYFDKLFAEYDPINRTTAPEGGVTQQPLELPSYMTIDAFARFDFPLGNINATLLGNVNNLLDTEYIAEGTDSSIDRTQVYYGFGRTYTISLKLKF